MRLLWNIALFTSCVSAFALSPFITPAPQVAKREAALNICGYYSFNGSVSTISCLVGTPCMVAQDTSPAIGYCSNIGNIPVTTIYQFGYWPSEEGCMPGSACCPLATPSVGKFLFNGGATVFLGCGLAPFTYDAFSTKPEVVNPSTPAVAQTPAPAAATTTSLPHSTPDLLLAITTTPISDITTTPAAPHTSQTPTSSSLSSTTTTTVIVVAAVVALVGGLVFLWFLIMAWKIHQAHKYPQQQYIPVWNQNSTTSLHSGAPIKKSGLSKWAKIATVISPIFAVVGLAVAIYFGLKPQK